MRPPRVQSDLLRGKLAVSALPRTRVRGTGALREILPYYRWGMCAGVLGAFVVAVFFLAPSATLVAAYTAVHGALFVSLALLVSSLVLGSRRRRRRS